MSPDDKIIAASLEALRAMTIFQLREERENMHRYVLDAVSVSEALIDYVIREKLHGDVSLNTIN